MNSEEGFTVGVVVGVVKENQDPEGLHRVRVQYLGLAKDAMSGWAPVATPLAGKERGLFLLPEVGDQVLVAFSSGDIDAPFVIGALWNKDDNPPVPKKSSLHMLKSKSGHTILLDDTDGKERIVIKDKGGAEEIVFDAQNKSLSLTSGGDLTICAKGGITLKCDGDVKIACASFTTEAKASAGIKAPKVEIG